MFYDVFLISSAVLLLHDGKRSICTRPLTFYERRDLERTRLACYVTRFKMDENISARSFLFQIFPNLMNGSNFDKAERKTLHGKYFVIEILKKRQQFFHRDRKHVRLELNS